MKWHAHILAFAFLSAQGVVAVPAFAQSSAAECESGPRAVVHAIQAATSARDANGVVANFSDRVDVQTIYPWGERVLGKAAHLQWHQEWFAEDGWSFASVEEVAYRERRDTATLVYRIDYRKPDRPPLIYYFTYNLERENGQWRVVMMQGSAVQI